MNIFEDFVETIPVQNVPGSNVFVVAAVIAAVLAFSPAWRFSRNFITVAHEGSHALMGLLWGRRLSGIKLHSDTSGVTVSRGKPRGLGMIFTSAAGYPGPAFMGLGLAWLLVNGYLMVSFFIVVVIISGMLLMIRNLYGLLLMIVLASALFGVYQWATPTGMAFFLSVLSGFLLIGSVRPVFELQMKRAHGEAPDSDADQLFRLSLVPGTIWVLLFFVATIVCNYLSFQIVFQ